MVGAIDRILAAIAESGLLLAPRSRLVRDHSYLAHPSGERRLLATSTFTLQWHLTQVCDHQCRHCYDRGRRDSRPFGQAVAILEDLHDCAGLHHDSVQVSFSGCTGFGCGTAFNVVSLVPDGEVHACRKFPLPIGNIRSQSFAEISHSEPAARYGNGPSDCLDCRLRPACKGCMAVTWGFGRQVFTEGADLPNADPTLWYLLCRSCCSQHGHDVGSRSDLLQVPEWYGGMHGFHLDGAGGLPVEDGFQFRY